MAWCNKLENKKDTFWKWKKLERKSTSPHSLDLRKKVIMFLEEGNSLAKTAKTFFLNIKTVHAWYQRYKTEGHFFSSN